MKKGEILNKLTDSSSRWKVAIADGITGYIKTIENLDIGKISSIISENINSDWLIVIDNCQFKRKELESVQEFVFRFKNRKENYFIYIVPNRKAPTRMWRFDGICNSFMTRVSTLRRNMKTIKDTDISSVCYVLSFSILNSANHTDGFLATTLLASKPIQFHKFINNECAIIISHHGKFNYLKTCLSYLNDFHKLIYLGFDINKVNSRIDALINKYKNIKYYISNFNKNGPYGIRHELIINSTENLCIFQDSDDVSCADRFNEIVSAFAYTNAEFIGSHEIRVDEIEECVKIYRYPLNVNEALNKAPNHCLLFPTSAIKKDSYQKIGGFSNYLRFGLDTQFLLRSHFQLEIRNLDSFLYIRRRRKGSLTTHPKTALGTKIRLESLKQWKRDFGKIRSGKIEIDNSSISAFKKFNVKLIKIQSNEEDIL